MKQRGINLIWKICFEGRHRVLIGGFWTPGPVSTTIKTEEIMWTSRYVDNLGIIMFIRGS
jgi:hypothetical protein